MSSEKEAATGAVLASGDPEPPPGTVVRDGCGLEWVRDDEGGSQGWTLVGRESDPESWTKIAGNYGPVTVIEMPED